MAAFNDIFRRQLRGRLERFQNFQARGSLSAKQQDDLDLSDADKIMCVFTERPSAERFADCYSDVLHLSMWRSGPSVSAVLARVEDLRVRAPRISGKSVLSFIPRADWDDHTLVITPRFFQPVRNDGTHMRVEGQLAYELPVQQLHQCNAVIDGNMLLCRVGLKISKEHRYFLLPTDWEKDVMDALKVWREEKECVPGQLLPAPPGPQMLIRQKAD